MALKKSQLYSSLWQSCDELRGGMDPSQYKDYILTLLFMKYVSDKSEHDPDALIVVPKGGSFADMVKLKGDKEIGDKINKIVGKLAEANDLKGVIDQADFNDEGKLGSGKEMQDRLSKLVGIFNGFDFRANRAEGDDLLGDAYEYLMRHFATESGKSKGQFYTPAEVSRIMAQVIGIDGAAKLNQPTVYDPTCGSGSLLIKAADEAPGKAKLAIYGQEMDVATWALARMNMILHGHETHDIHRGNTLAAPGHKEKGGLKRFDFAVANPPFSFKSWSSGLNPAEDEFKRFEYGIPPTKNGDYAFLLHLIASLKSKGKGAIILPHGVLFRGNKEADIRRNLIRRGYIKGIIGLPPNLFYGTGIPACIVVIDKEHADQRAQDGGIFMIDASRGFVKDGNKNRLRSQDIHKIVDVFNKQLEVPRYSRMVPNTEIAGEANDYNLNIPRYIDSSEPEDLHDLHAHLNGGIPNRDIDALDPYWQVLPSLRGVLFQNNGREGYSEARVETRDVKPTILNHLEFQAFNTRVMQVFNAWRDAHRPMLLGIKVDDLPKQIIRTLSEDLLARFTGLPLIDRYNVYQRLMEYWADVMQDDVYLIAADGWQEAARPRDVIEDKDRKIKEEPDLTVKRKKYKMDLIPPALIVARYFAAEQAAIDDLQAKQDAAFRELEEYTEEHSGEEGLLADATNDKGNVTKGEVQKRLKAIEHEAESDEERQALTRCLELIEAESKAGKAVKDAQAALDEKTLKQYAKLTEDEIKTLVVIDKWIASLHRAIESEVQRLTQQLATRVKELEERYARPLPDLECAIDVLNKKNRTAQNTVASMALSPTVSNNWKASPLGELFKFSGGVTASRAQLSEDGYCYLHYGDIHGTDKQFVDVKAEFQNIPKLNIDLARVPGKSLLADGDVVFVDASEDDEGTSKHVVVVNSDATPYISGLHTIVAKAKTDELAHAYRRYCFQAHKIKQQFRFYAVGTKVSGISKTNIAKILLEYPDKDEQEAIATVLSDMDAEIAALEQRLQKARAIKQGMMQQLLTGRIRLIKPEGRSDG